jgi:hypothetical protein
MSNMVAPALRSKYVCIGILACDTLYFVVEFLHTFRWNVLSFLCSEYKCTTYQATRRHNPETQNLNLYCCESLRYHLSGLVEIEINARMCEYGFCVVLHNRITVRYF